MVTQRSRNTVPIREHKRLNTMDLEREQRERTNRKRERQRREKKERHWPRTRNWKCSGVPAKALLVSLKLHLKCFFQMGLMAEWLENRAINQKIAGSILGREK